MARTKTYTPDFTATQDQIRLKIGDNDTNDMLLYDDEIAQAYAVDPTILSASVLACRWCIAILSREFDKNIDGLSTKRSQRHKAMLGTLQALIEERKDTSFSWSAPSEVSYTKDTGEPGESDGTIPEIFQPCDVAAPEWIDE